MNITFLAAAGGLGDLVTETAESFGFDVWIFFSQVISFVIVALLLKQFAYKRIGAVLEERRQRIAEGLLNAEKILAKAREASVLEHERTMSQLKRELGRLVVDTTTKVTGKILTPEDQKRLQEEASRQVAS